MLSENAPSTTGRWDWRPVVAVLALLVLVAPLAWMWQDSRVAGSYSVMDMGVADLGGGPRLVELAAGGDHHGDHGTSVADLTGPQDGEPDVAVTLTAGKGSFRLATGEQVDGYTLDGASPGPELRVQQGDLVEVTLVNEGVEDGVTLHWHGVDVPNAEDGVAGVTQDAVPAGGRHVYRFVAEDAGTYWYHSHQVSHEQVRGGLWGVLVVEPADAPDVDDVVAAVHTYDGVRTVSGRTGTWEVDAEPGSTRRLRLVNTDNGPLRAWLAGAPFRVVAVDGFDVTAPEQVRDRLLVLAAGGRYDLEVTVPAGGARLELDGGLSVALGDDAPTGPAPEEELDLLSYGGTAPLPFDVEDADRSFDYRIGRRPGFLDGRPGFWWTVNGRMFPDVPMYHVAEGDVVRMTVENGSGDVHPMHLHGHHAVVLSRNGVAATGSPWWVDSLNVEDGETYEIAFLADNPGIWMDHCHNLAHAAEGLVAHLMYAGVTTPYVVGGGAAENAPE